MICPRCHFDCPPEFAFCPKCGTLLQQACPKCGCQVPAEFAFCPKCGSAVAAPAVAAERDTQAMLSHAIQRQIPKEYAERLLATRGQPHDERRTVTILFSDIKGSTAMIGQLDPEDAKEIIQGAFEFLIAPIYRYEGTLVQLMGDAILAFFGAPIAHEDDPERACRAALDITAEAANYAEKLRTERGIEGFDVRVGINTGLVVVGEVGSDLRVAYTAIGDAINLAARMEQNAEPGRVLITEATHRLIVPIFETQAMPPLQVKGKAEPLQTYRVLAPRAVAGKVRGIPGLESPLVGREAEFAALREAIERLRAGVGGIVTVVGEAGIGKSRLVAEARKLATPAAGSRTDAQAQVQWVEGRCLSYGTSIPYVLWLDMLRALLRLQLDTPPEELRARLREWVGTLCAGRFDAVYSYLARLMPVPLQEAEQAALRDLDGETLKANTFGAVRTLIECAAKQRPLVLVCEDLHWADPSSVELLESALELTDRASVLFVCLFRPQRACPCWRIREIAARDYPHRHSDVWLQPLAPAESQALVQNLLRTEAVPEQLRQRILGAAEGNPLYVEEVLRALIDQGTVIADEAAGRWQVTGAATTVELPQTLQGVLVARIDRLQEDTKRVLQLASVIGRVFLERVLAVIAFGETEKLPPVVACGETAKLPPAIAYGETAKLPPAIAYGETAKLPPAIAYGETAKLPPAIAEEEKGLAEHLLTLQRQEMIRERARIPELEYIFKHELTREAAYNGLPKAERRAFHRRVAEALEQLFRGRLDEQLGLLAYHWEAAGDADKAAQYLLRAGDQSRVAYAHQEAIGFYRRALVFLKDQAQPEAAARTLMKLGLAYHAALDFPEARAAFEEGFRLWQRAAQTPPGPLPPAPHALRMAWADPETLDPTKYTLVDTQAVLFQLFPALVQESADLGVAPGAAQTWEVSPDGCRWTFHLRRGVHWSDGTPVTAGDFEYTCKRMLSPATGSPLATLLYVIRGARAFHQGQVSDLDSVGVQAADEFTLLVELEQPCAYLLHLFARQALPRHVVERHGDAWVEPGHIVTSGPFRLESMQPGQSLVLARDAAYRGARKGNVERVELRLRTPDGLQAELARYEAGGLDVLCIDYQSPERWSALREAHAGEYASAPELALHFFAMDTSQAPLDDRRVRQALAMATDRELLFEVALRGNAFPALGGFIPPGMPGHSAAIGWPYDPERARRLLAEAGYPEGRGFPTLRLQTVLGPTARIVNPCLQAQWRENLGIAGTYEMVPAELMEDTLRTQRPHLALNGWIADYPDPDTFLRVAINHWLQFTHWRHEAYQELVQRAQRARESSEGLAAYTQADRILVEEAAFVPLAYTRTHWLAKPWIRNYVQSPTGIPFWQDVVIEPHVP